MLLSYAGLNRLLPRSTFTFSRHYRRIRADHVPLHHLPTVQSVKYLSSTQLRSYTSSSEPPQLSQPSKPVSPSPSYPSRPSSGYLNSRSYNFPKDAPPPKPDGNYPHTLPPQGTWHHWFLTNKSLHFYLSFSILFGLAAFASVASFMKASRFAHLVHWDWSHPIESVASYVDAYRLDMEEKSRQAMEKRRRKLEDFEKRGEYRKAHGLEQAGNEGGFGEWELKRKLEESERQG